MIALLQQADFKFDPTDVDTDLHKRVFAAIQDGFIKRFDMRVSRRDSDQDLSMWMLDVEEVVREIMGEKRLAGHQHFKFERCLRDNRQLSDCGEQFGHEFFANGSALHHESRQHHWTH
jgi:hypothetical protein